MFLRPLTSSHYRKYPETLPNSTRSLPVPVECIWDNLCPAARPPRHAPPPNVTALAIFRPKTPGVKNQRIRLPEGDKGRRLAFPIKGAMDKVDRDGSLSHHRPQPKHEGPADGQAHHERVVCLDKARALGRRGSHKTWIAEARGNRTRHSQAPAARLSCFCFLVVNTTGL